MNSGALTADLGGRALAAGASSAAAVLSGLSVAPAPGARGAVLRDLSLRIDAGQQVAVIGASGAGKTTLLMAMACALRPLSGSISLFGTDPWALSSGERQRLRARLFLAPQTPPLPPRQRVVTAVLAGRLPAMGLIESLRTLWHPRDAARAQQALASLDLADKLWDRVDRLSGGERQRVGLARALVSQADLWLVDEPLSALDPTRARRAIEVLSEAAAREGRTLVCSLHQVPVAREAFPRVLALRAGALVYDGPGAGLSDELLHELYGDEAPDAPAQDDAPADDTGAPSVPRMVCR